ncbi:MAG: alpha/beta fold hydrolase, partial [Armatimonadetes bacterium]|nr:alpha/beta fold hydrolase [Anaerolineae bacterium]
MRYRIKVGLLLALLAMGMGSQAQRPDAPTFALPGAYLVGVQDFTVADATEADPARPLPISVWYPAQASDAEPVVYITQRTSDLARRAAPVADSGAPYPLVLFSHGSGGGRSLSSFLMEQLASYGYVVMAVDHPGNTFLDESNPLTRAAFGANIRVNYAQRPLDVLRLIAYAEALNAPDGALAGMMDTDSIVVMGHSFGGYTALAVAGGQLDLNAFSGWCSAPTGLAWLPGAAVLSPIAADPRLNSARYDLCDFQDLAPVVAQLRGYDAPPDGLLPAT